MSPEETWATEGGGAGGKERGPMPSNTEDKVFSLNGLGGNLGGKKSEFGGLVVMTKSSKQVALRENGRHEIMQMERFFYLQEGGNQAHASGGCG